MKLAYSFSSLYSFSDALEMASQNSEKAKQGIFLQKEIQPGVDILIFNTKSREEISWFQFSDNENEGIAVCFWQFEVNLKKMENRHLNPLIKRPEGIHIIPCSSSIDFETKKNTVLKGIILLIKHEYCEFYHLNNFFQNINKQVISLNVSVSPFIKHFLIIKNIKKVYLNYQVEILLKLLKNDKALSKLNQRTKERIDEERKVEYVVNLLNNDINSIRFDSEFIASMANIKYTRLKKVFKIMYGMDILAYRRMIRMKKAYEYVELGLKKREIALFLGYNGRTNQFTHMFKKFYGYAPE